MATVGEDSPLDSTVRQCLGTAQIPQHLGRRHLVILVLGATAAFVLAVQQALPAFIFDDDQTVLVAVSLVLLSVGTPLVVRCFEQQHVRNVGASLRGGSRLCEPSITPPAERLQDRVDQVVLGLGLIRMAVDRKSAIGAAQRIDDCRLRSGARTEEIHIRRHRPDAVAKEVIRK